MEIARHYGRIVPLDDVIASQLSGVRDELQIAVTFDDGYSENMDWVIPFLLVHKIPATYFVTTDFVESGRSFPHDVERGQKLLPNTIEHIKEMARNGIQIGGHTASHLDLGKYWSKKVLKREIMDSRKKLQDWDGAKRRTFRVSVWSGDEFQPSSHRYGNSSRIQGFCIGLWRMDSHSRWRSSPPQDPWRVWYGVASQLAFARSTETQNENTRWNSHYQVKIPSHGI